jgi:hypothetical protein
MDGVESTYERFRGRPFEAFKQHLMLIQSIAPFGINYLVNAYTIADLDVAIALAADIGARELLLLPEQPVRGVGGVDSMTLQALKDWVWRYKGPVPLTLSEAAADGMPACRPVSGEMGLSAYAHVDAAGSLKRSSFEKDGILIGPKGLMEALAALRLQETVK